MKKTIVFLLLAAIFISSCSLLASGEQEATPLVPTPTMMPAAALDPCAPENLLEEVEKVQKIVNHFQDVSFVAANVNLKLNPNDLLVPILKLQDIRRDLENLDVPACEDAIKASSINYMISHTNSLISIMGAGDQDQFDAAIESLNYSNALWQVVVSEFSNLLSSAGLINEAIPDISSSAPSATDSGIFISNDGTQGVNIRGLPDLNGVIIASLEPGMQAIGLARTEAGDWVQVNLDGVIGWIFAETISSDEPLDSLPVFEPVQ